MALYNAEMLLHYLSLRLVVEVDPDSHIPSSPLQRTFFCRKGPDIPSVTDSDVFSEVDDNESPVNVLGPASPLSQKDSCIPVPTTDVLYV